MKRTNTLIVEDAPALRTLADNCARLYNEVNYERRQAYIRYKRFEWYPKHLYEKYTPLVGSATAQQIINKNNEAWRSFLALKRLEGKGKLPPHITKVSLPRYWKRNGKRELRIVVRNDCYKVNGKHLYLPNGLKVRIKGSLKWYGKQGRLEIFYNDVDEAWMGFMTVEVEKPPIREGGKPLYIDLGVVNLAAVWFEVLKHPVAFSGRTVLADWWYWTRRIAKEQSRLARINKANASRRLRRLYRIRQRRFRHAVNAMIKTIVEDAAAFNISKIVVGNLKGIRDNNHNNKANTMINNFWSFNYIIQRIREKTEEHGIKVAEVSEHKTSSICPRCRSGKVIKRGRLFKCIDCGVEANRDSVGVLNIGLAWGTKLPAGAVNGAMARPLLLRWDGMKWKPKRAVNNQPMKTLEARISRLQPWKMSKADLFYVF